MSDPNISPPTLTQLFRIYTTYFCRHGHLPDLDNPRRFTEWVQHRKLHDRDPRMPQLADKVAVKPFVAEQLDTEWVTPTLWHGDRLPAEMPCKPPFVIKPRHSCNRIIFVHSENADWSAIRKTANGWTDKGYGYWLDEWAYRDIPRGILVEPFIGQAGIQPVDYKFYVFGGRVKFIQLHLDRGTDHRWILFDPEWKRVSARTDDADPPPPLSLKSMIAGAEKLAQGFDFIRADFYEIRGQPVFGEITFYPGSGLDPFDPVSLDMVIGTEWSKARNQSTDSVPIPLPPGIAAKA